MMRIGMVVVLALLLTNTGCTMHLGGNNEVAPAGQDAERAYKAKLLRIEDGTTPRAEVERILGTPDYAEEDRRLAAYRWQGVRYSNVTVDVGRVRIGDEDEDEEERGRFVQVDADEDDDERAPRNATSVVYNTLLLQFDEAGFVIAHRSVCRSIQHGGPPSLPTMLARWQSAVASR